MTEKEMMSTASGFRLQDDSMSLWQYRSFLNTITFHEL